MNDARQKVIFIIRLALLAACVVVLFSGCHSPFGVYHTVQRGETLYAIGQTYGVSAEELARANYLRNPNQIYVGQQVFVPGASEVKRVQPTEKAARQASKPAGTSGGSGGPRKVASLSPHGPRGTGQFMWPTEGVLTSNFGTRGGRFHSGIDLSAPTGTPVVAAADGEVIHAANQRNGYGNLIIIKHGSDYFTVYGHLHTIEVQPGDNVRKGQQIGQVGNTGRSSGPHLHFEIRHRKEAIDPLTLLP